MSFNIFREFSSDDEMLQYFHEEIQMQGRHDELLQQRSVYKVAPNINMFVECNILHLSLKDGRSKAILLKLMEIGGRELVMQKDGYGYNVLQIIFQNIDDHALHTQVPIEVVLELIEIGGREIVMEGGSEGETILHNVSSIQETPIVVVSKLIDIGGRELAMVGDNDNDTALHYACIAKATIEVISKIIDIGGSEVVLVKNESSSTALHYACTTLFSTEVVVKLIETGGEELVMYKDQSGYTALHKVFINNDNITDGSPIPIEVVSKLIGIGGRRLVMEKNDDGSTVLHLACRHNFSIKLCSKLINIGGHQLIMETDHIGDTPLHDACKNQPSTVDVISQLINIGGKEIVRKRNNYGLHALHYYFLDTDDEYRDYGHHITFGDDFILMIEEGIAAQIGGEFGIGGLFSALARNHEIQGQIYDKWENFVPSLQRVMATLQPPPPLLHAAIIARAPRHIIIAIINQFQCVLTKDSLNRYPINVAIEQDLEWSGGMQELIEATAVGQQRPRIYVAAQYGLKWSNHMSEIVETHLEEVLEGVDNITGLHLFMLAAMGNSCDLSSIYMMMRLSPFRVLVRRRTAVAEY